MANALYVLFEIKHSDSKNKAVSQMRNVIKLTLG